MRDEMAMLDQEIAQLNTDAFKVEIVTNIDNDWIQTTLRVTAKDGCIADSWLEAQARYELGIGNSVDVLTLERPIGDGE